MNNNKTIIASAYSAIIAGIAVAVVTITADMYAPLKNLLASMTGHHWVTKSIGTMVLYLLLLLLFRSGMREPSTTAPRRALWLLFLFTILSALAIFLFYVWHYFG